MIKKEENFSRVGKVKILKGLGQGGWMESEKCGMRGQWSCKREKKMDILNGM